MPPPRPRPGYAASETATSLQAPAAAAPRSTDDAPIQGGGSISVARLVRWLTSIIPVLLSSDGKSPSELLAGLMTSLLALLQDG